MKQIYPHYNNYNSDSYLKLTSQYGIGWYLKVIRTANLMIQGLIEIINTIMQNPINFVGNGAENRHSHIGPLMRKKFVCATFKVLNIIIRFKSFLILIYIILDPFLYCNQTHSTKVHIWQKPQLGYKGKCQLCDGQKRTQKFKIY